MLQKKCGECGEETWLSDAGFDELTGRFYRDFSCKNGHVETDWFGRDPVPKHKPQRSENVDDLRKLNKLLEKFEAVEKEGGTRATGD